MESAVLAMPARSTATSASLPPSAAEIACSASAWDPATEAALMRLLSRAHTACSASALRPVMTTCSHNQRLYDD